MADIPVSSPKHEYEPQKHNYFAYALNTSLKYRYSIPIDYVMTVFRRFYLTSEPYDKGREGAPRVAL